MRIKKGFEVVNAGDKSVVSVNKSESNVDFNGVVVLNDVGLLIWNQLAEHCTYDELIKYLLDCFFVPETELKKDVDAFLKKIEFAISFDDEG